MPLTHLKVERAKPKEKQYKLSDERFLNPSAGCKVAEPKPKRYGYGATRLQEIERTK
jgi:hypothetical protein